MQPFKPYRVSSLKGRGQAASAYWLLPDKSVHTDLRGSMHPRRATTDVPRPVNSNRPQLSENTASIPLGSDPVRGPTPF